MKLSVESGACSSISMVRSRIFLPKGGGASKMPLGRFREGSFSLASYRDYQSILFEQLDSTEYFVGARFPTPIAR